MNAPADLSIPGVLEAVARAAEFRLIGLLLERPREASRAEAGALAGEVRDPALRSLAGRLAALGEPEYVGLLGPGGPVSPREAAYCRREDPGRVMADVAGFYRAFGFEPRAEDPIDHAAVEAGFAGYLCLKEAYALSRGDREAAEVTALARGRFLAAHLGPLAAGMAARLEGGAATDLLALARLLLERTGVPALAADGAVEEEEDPSCGGCAAPGG